MEGLFFSSPHVHVNDIGKHAERNLYLLAG